ncbi:MAG TPA: CmcI family methyltransferase [Bryobacteraceae bacterium]|jgi:cephalosporin hydroxylase|nr:CmcI family methyltransferase [Bryobacteraceae bacterium]
MKITIDTNLAKLFVEDGDKRNETPLFSPEAFAEISRQWMRIGWSLDYYHRFHWMGVPVLQLPEDLVRLQEAFYRIRPDFVVETGIFGGGSLLFAASLFGAMGHGHVIGVEKDLRDDARETLSTHPLARRITAIEGDSIAPETLQAVRALTGSGTVMVVLDSNHSAGHVAKELEAYAPLVTPGSCLVVEDAVMKDLADVPGGDPSWDNPGTAIEDFAKRHPEFQREEASTPYNRSVIRDSATYWPGGWLWRK